MHSAMLPGDLTAIPADRLDLTHLPPDDRLATAPEHIYVPPAPESRASRLSRLVPSVVISVVVHAVLAAAFLVVWHAMLKELNAPEPISVEVVDHIPGEGKRDTKPEAPKAAEPKAPEAEAKPKPPEPEPKKPLSTLEQALPPPASPLDATAPKPQPTPPQPVAAKPDAQGPQPATPPMPDTAPPSDQPRTDAPKAGAPGLTEAPPEAAPATTQKEKNEAANLSEVHPKDPTPPPASKPAPAPHVLTAQDGADSVPMPSDEPAPLKPSQPPAPEPAQKPDPNAQLAAALPMNFAGMPSTFRSVVTGMGDARSAQYKGTVFGAFNRLQLGGVIASARRAGLRSVSVALMVTIGDDGGVQTVSVMQSSGRGEVDSMVMDEVRRQVHVPPPPPGAPRTFGPSIAFGSEE